MQPGRLSIPQRETFLSSPDSPWPFPANHHPPLRALSPQAPAATTRVPSEQGSSFLFFFLFFFNLVGSYYTLEFFFKVKQYNTPPPLELCCHALRRWKNSPPTPVWLQPLSLTVSSSPSPDNKKKKKKVFYLFQVKRKGE